MYESICHEKHHHRLESRIENNNTACISSSITDHPCPPRVSIQQLYYETKAPPKNAACTTSIPNLLLQESNNDDDYHDKQKLQERLVRIMGSVVSYTMNNNNNETKDTAPSTTNTTTATTIILTIDDGTGLLQVQCPLQMIYNLVGKPSSCPPKDDLLSSLLMGQTLDCIGSIQQTCVATVPQQQEGHPPPHEKEHPQNKTESNNNNSTTNDPRWFLQMMADTLIFISSNDPNLQTLRWFQMYHHDDHSKNPSSSSSTPSLSPSSSCCSSLLPTTINPTKQDVLRLIKECGKNTHGPKQQQDGPTLDELLLVLGMDCEDNDDNHNSSHNDTDRSTVLRHMLQEMQGNGDVYVSRQGTYLPL